MYEVSGWGNPRVFFYRWLNLVTDA